MGLLDEHACDGRGLWPALPLDKVIRPKAEIWDNLSKRIPVGDYKTDDDFRWITQEGESIAVEDMNTFHLFHSLRMIWNHSVPPEYRFIPFKPYHLRITRARRRVCVANLTLELLNRHDRTMKMDEVLIKMCDYVVASKNKKLPAKLF